MDAAGAQCSPMRALARGVVVLLAACPPGAARPDAGPSDAGVPDARPVDAGAVDAGAADAGPLLGAPYDAAPDGSTLVDSAAFLSLLGQGRLVVTGPGAVADQQSAAAAQDAANQATLDDFAAMNPDAGALIRGVEDGIAAGATGAELLGNGDVQVTLYDANGNPVPLIVGGRSPALASLANGVRVFP